MKKIIVLLLALLLAFTLIACDNETTDDASPEYPEIELDTPLLPLT